MRWKIHILWAVGIVLVIVVFLVVVAKYVVFSETAYDKQTSRYEQELLDARELDGVKRLEKLKELAKKVGAGHEHTEIGTPVRIDPHTVMTPQTPISESELSQNIHNALQTRASLSGSKASTKSNRIAFAAFAVSVLLGGSSLIVAIIALVTSGRRESERLRIEQRQEVDKRLEGRRATISAKLEHLQQQGRYELIIQNDGASEARDVKVGLNGEALSQLNSIQPPISSRLVIGARSSFNYHWKTGEDVRPPFDLEITWSDDSGEDRNYRTTLPHPTAPK